MADSNTGLACRSRTNQTDFLTKGLNNAPFLQSSCHTRIDGASSKALDGVRRQRP